MCPPPGRPSLQSIFRRRRLHLLEGFLQHCNLFSAATSVLLVPRCFSCQRLPFLGDCFDRDSLTGKMALPVILDRFNWSRGGRHSLGALS
ncbi:hypothetical protein BRADI_2g22221v3 [Brachypodium distachyon]|uniref:Uncharacterized protein n=1 Tax=Brachypodium distachyon TaxID=15368 RepID=A0A2K2D9U0_BRADI|nr:hypothetical protein BRADI_2g22221v3 [Brachypodium distachyon]